MNTVDALKKLYKTMAGEDWPYDPNPTDAEVIDKIAADASGGGEETKAYFPLSIDPENPMPMVITPFADILAATQKGIPCAVVIDNKINGYWGVGHIIMEGSNVREIKFVTQYSINTAGSTKSVSFSIINLFSDGTVAVDNASVIAS